MVPRLGAFLRVSRMDGGGTATCSHQLGTRRGSVPDLLSRGIPVLGTSWGTKGPPQHPSAPAEQLRCSWGAHEGLLIWLLPNINFTTSNKLVKEKKREVVALSFFLPLPEPLG